MTAPTISSGQSIIGSGNRPELARAEFRVAAFDFLQAQDSDKKPNNYLEMFALAGGALVQESVRAPITEVEQCDVINRNLSFVANLKGIEGVSLVDPSFLRRINRMALSSIVDAKGENPASNSSGPAYLDIIEQIKDGQLRFNNSVD